MYWGISLAFFALVILILWQDWKLQKLTKAAEHWRLQASENGSEAAYWRGMNTCCAQENADLRKQAEAFEQAAKAMEETLAGARERADRLKQSLLNECDRADRLEGELQMSEGERNSLKLQMQEARGKQAGRDDDLIREMRNVLCYDGTAASQEALRDD